MKPIQSESKSYGKWYFVTGKVVPEVSKARSIKEFFLECSTLNAGLFIFLQNMRTDITSQKTGVFVNEIP
jgi:hypothetical protein